MNSFSRMKFTMAAAVALCFVGNVGSLRADVKPAALFSDHMVLQQGMSVPVWGWADPGEQVTVSIAGQTQTATAGADRKWMVHLTNLKAAADPIEMTIAGKNTIKITDILVGEVWLGSGQSNMSFTVSSDTAKYPGMAQRYAGVANEAQEIAAADYPRIREFSVPSKLSATPLDDVAGKWKVCSPQTVPGFSAIGYLFSRNLQKAINQPVGFITSAFGGSCAQAWVSKDVLEADDRLKASVDAASRGGSSAHNPFLLWNAMIKPIEPYAIKGTLWYQGESITEGLQLYPVVIDDLITSWRKEWGQGDFPFIFVQLAAEDANSNRPEVREAQTLALKLPHTAMAVAMDIGEKTNVHPKDKQDLCDRLARIARATVYGEKIEYCGPTYDGMLVEGSTIRVKFTHVSGGLVARGGDLKWFQIAGADKNFVDATAKIDASTIVVSAPGVAAPVAVRYGWNRWPEGVNLYNSDGLPAPQFRSDDWAAAAPAPAARAGRGATTAPAGRGRRGAATAPAGRAG